MIGFHKIKLFFVIYIFWSNKPVFSLEELAKLLYLTFSKRRSHAENFYKPPWIFM